MNHDTGIFGRRSIGQRDNILCTLLPLSSTAMTVVWSMGKFSSIAQFVIDTHVFLVLLLDAAEADVSKGLFLLLVVAAAAAAGSLAFQ
jgi:hypothetical protein